MATYSNIFAQKITWTEQPGGPQSIGSQRIRHDSANTHHHMRWSPWDQHQWRKKEAEEEGREKLRCNISPTTGLAKPTGAIELE